MKDCPFCGKGMWVEAADDRVHCRLCGSSAPTSVWNERSELTQLQHRCEITEFQLRTCAYEAESVENVAQRWRHHASRLQSLLRQTKEELQQLRRRYHAALVAEDTAWSGRTSFHVRLSDLPRWQPKIVVWPDDFVEEE